VAIGDDAAAAGFPLVADVDLVKDGAKELNRTRDIIAQTKSIIPVGHPAYQLAAGITAGSAEPTGGADGDIYFKILG
jgi:hypothetical protein